MRLAPRRARATQRRSRSSRWLVVLAWIGTSYAITQFILVSVSLHHPSRRGYLGASGVSVPDHQQNFPGSGNRSGLPWRSTKGSSDGLIATGKKPVRFLCGIMSYQHKLEERRRDKIRRTYLAYYRHFTETPSRICALVDVLQTNDTSKYAECELIYTFVIGGNPLGPSQLLEYNDTFPLLANSNVTSGRERDITWLNIKENGKFGKSPTWFKYGLTLLDDHPNLFDYIVKMDTDTALYPHAFFEMVERRRLPPSPLNKRIYGGSPFDKFMCGYPEHDHCHNLTAPLYMGGGFYFLSTDLAEYITGPDCPRSKLFLPHEDMTTGNYVFSHPLNITTIQEKGGYEHLWRHAVKNPNRLVHFYLLHLKRLSRDGVITQEQLNTWNLTFHQVHDEP